MRITVLAGGVGGARFVRGVRELDAEVSVVVNTGDDLWLTGLRVCPDLDSIMYALAGVSDTERGWGRAGETERISAELAEWGLGWPWFTLGDLDLATHIARTSLLREGLRLTEVTERLSARWPLGVRLLPATDDEVETHVVTADGQDLHFEEWWVRTRAAAAARRFVQRGVERAHATPEALAAIADADVVLLAPSNPVVSIGTILGLPGIRSALRDTEAPVVGVSPIIGGAVVRGMADACLATIGVGTDAAAVARHYGARRDGGLLDGWLVDDADAASVAGLRGSGFAADATGLWMTDAAESARIARAALALVSR
ncbi:2-phospho-L-lactate transferase [Desertivibrio insolitus]|uniref:2-phospho-L-lactate transferase n=1 Tax=Herbiconiux sp. SYSU D00978 TaxID=2812562 RepID=UPI001A96F297|nr:2-phospho-L-lactate transferase [Herbiconiux sp. SYSU D00978]